MGTCAWCTAGTWHHLHLVPGDQRCGRGGGGGGGRGSRRAGGTEVHCLISTSCQDFREQPRMLQNCLELFKFHLTLLHLTLETSEWFKLHLLSTALHVWRGLAGVGGGDHQQGGRPCHVLFNLCIVSWVFVKIDLLISGKSSLRYNALKRFAAAATF